MQLFTIEFLTLSIKDLIDIALLTVLIYRLYLIMRGTRAAQMLLGLIIIVFVSVIAQIMNMTGLNWFFDQLKTVWIIAFVIIFQPELRRLLVFAGQTPVLRRLFRGSERVVLAELAKSADELSRRRYGGLIVITRDVGLRGVIESGVQLNATVTSALIVSVFSPRSVLHDGAIIVHDDVIEAAKCILPLSENLDHQLPVGTRHRAGLGITEETDAVVIIVSEETGKISLAIEGQLTTDLESKDLLELLTDIFSPAARKNENGEEG